MNFIKNVGTIVDKINTVFIALSGTLLIVVSLAIAVNTLTRYFLNVAFTLLLEFTEYSMVWMTFLGAAWLAKRNGHVNIDLVVAKLNPKAQKYVNTVTLAVAIVLFIILVCFSVYVVYNDFKANLILQTVLQPPKWIFEIIIPIGSLLLLVQLIVKLGENIADIKNGKY